MYKYSDNSVKKEIKEASSLDEEKGKDILRRTVTGLTREQIDLANSQKQKEIHRLDDIQKEIDKRLKMEEITKELKNLTDDDYMNDIISSTISEVSNANITAIDASDHFLRLMNDEYIDKEISTSSKEGEASEKQGINNAHLFQDSTTQKDIIQPTEKPKKPKDIVKERMLNAIKEKHKKAYQSIWDRAVKKGKEPFFRWYGELNIRAFEINGTINVVHTLEKIAEKNGVSARKISQLDVGQSYKNIKCVSFKDVINSNSVIYDINYKFKNPIEFDGNLNNRKDIENMTNEKKEKLQSELKGIYFTDSYVDLYNDINIKSLAKEERIDLAKQLSFLYQKRQEGRFMRNEAYGFTRCRELE